MLQASLNYPGNFLCDERMYVPALYGASVNYSGNSSSVFLVRRVSLEVMVDHIISFNVTFPFQGRI